MCVEVSLCVHVQLKYSVNVNFSCRNVAAAVTCNYKVSNFIFWSMAVCNGRICVALLVSVPLIVAQILMCL